MLAHTHAQDPAGFSTSADFIQRAAGSSLAVASPPLLWLSKAAKLRPFDQAVPAEPLWWAGGAWHKFNTHRNKAPAYVPRRFEPIWRCGSVLSCPSPSPIEAGPGEVCAPPGGSEVSQLLKVLLCGRDGQLWSKPVVGGQWCPCPYGVHVNMSRIKAFELLGGDRYIFFFQDGHGGICAGPDTVLMYDLQRNKWSPPTSARATRGGHQEEVHWQPLCAAQSGEPLKAWILEASMDYVLPGDIRVEIRLLRPQEPHPGDT
ncbi:unnamed protein product [Symbiodinium sp. CCMP2592]|nr:unnamed protein product [Symbiodinium sp. CCMP2592]